MVQETEYVETFEFQSQNGLILTISIKPFAINLSLISIPKWSDFNADYVTTSAIFANGFQSQNGLILPKWSDFNAMKMR